MRPTTGNYSSLKQAVGSIKMIYVVQSIKEDLAMVEEEKQNNTKEHHAHHWNLQQRSTQKKQGFYWKPSLQLVKE